MQIKQPEHLWFRENRMTIVADAESTDGRISVIDTRAPGDSGPPLHRHPNDETFYVLDGEIAFLVDGEIAHVCAGECAFVPGGATHTFRVVSPEARWIVICNPAGHEEMFRIAGEPAAGEGLPEVDGPPDMQRLMGAAAAVGAEILGPPPAELIGALSTR
jgi:mannose-6-phosphate isomerase-like protein (cupin superfamily)